MKIFIHYLSNTAGIDRATTGKGILISQLVVKLGKNSNGYRYVCQVSGVYGDTPKSAKCEQNSKIEMCNYTNL